MRCFYRLCQTGLVDAVGRTGENELCGMALVSRGLGEGGRCELPAAKGLRPVSSVWAGLGKYPAASTAIAGQDLRYDHAVQGHSSS